MEKELLLYATRDGKIPFSEWLDSLNRETRARIRMRLNRVRLGNLGDWKSVGNGVKELPSITEPVTAFISPSAETRW